MSTVEAIRKIATNHARSEISTEIDMLRFLRSWWSREFNRPLKDPLLAAYTLEELLYEYFIRKERAAAAEEAVEQQSDKIEDDTLKANLDWAAEEERKEQEELQKAEEAKKVLFDGKQQFGEDFGEDVSLDMT
jgi:hypothetical protein